MAAGTELVERAAPAAARGAFRPPPVVLALAVAAFLASRVAPGPAVAVAAALGAPFAPLLAVGLHAQGAPTVAACRMAARRWGRGDLRRSFRLVIDGEAVRHGLRAWAAAFAVALVAGRVTAGLGASSTEGDDRMFATVGPHGWALVVLVLAVVVAAPAVEELFYRGLLQAGLARALGTAPAIAVQGALFGLAHHPLPSSGAEVAAVVVLAGVGVVFGVTAHRHGLGASIVGHALFNGVTVASRLMG